MTRLEDKQAEAFINKHGNVPIQPTYGEGMVYMFLALSTLYNLYMFDKEFLVMDWICYAITIVASIAELKRQVVCRKKNEQVKEDLLGLLEMLRDGEFK